MLRKIILFTSLALTALPSFASSNQFTFVTDFVMRIDLIYQLYLYDAKENTSIPIVTTPPTHNKKVVLQVPPPFKGKYIQATVCTPDAYDGMNCFTVNHVTCPLSQYHYAIVHKLDSKYALQCIE